MSTEIIQIKNDRYKQNYLLMWPAPWIVPYWHGWHHRILNHASTHAKASDYPTYPTRSTREERRDKTYSFNSVVFRSVINSRFVFRGVFLLWAFTSALYITCLINGCVVFSLKSPRVSAFKLFFIKFIHIRTALLECFFLVLTLDLPLNQAYHDTSALRPHCSRSCALNDVLKSCDIERCEIDFCCSQSSDRKLYASAVLIDSVGLCTANGIIKYDPAYPNEMETKDAKANAAFKRCVSMHSYFFKHFIVIVTNDGKENHWF